MTGWHRSVRAAAAALITTLLALLMHVAAGGDFSLIGSGIVFVLVLWVSMIFAGRRLGLLGLSAILGFGQVLMHASMALPAVGTASMTSGSLAEAAAARHLGHMPSSAGSALIMTGHTPDLDGSGLGDSGNMAMLLAHLAAVALTAVVLKRGEDLLLSILQLALGPVRSVLSAFAASALTLAESTRRILTIAELPCAITAAVNCANHRRGPPALV